MPIVTAEKRNLSAERNGAVAWEDIYPYLQQPRCNMVYPMIRAAVAPLEKMSALRLAAVFSPAVF